jgi:3-mercaptopyruvate sulfurtransferase SseA
VLQTFGHEQVAVLEGGLPGWERAGYAVDTSAPSVPVTASASAAAAAAAVDASFRATLRVEAVRSMAQMLDNVKQPTQQVCG